MMAGVRKGERAPSFTSVATVLLLPAGQLAPDSWAPLGKWHKNLALVLDSDFNHECQR